MGQPESEHAPPITSALMPNLEAVRRFIVDMVKQGSIALLVTAVLGLLARMNELNVELVRKLQQSRRARPPSERARSSETSLTARTVPRPPKSPCSSGNSLTRFVRDRSGRSVI